MTRQTAQPLEHLSLNAADRQAREIARSFTEWKNANGYDPADRDEAIYACIDGQQRISTAREWFGDELAVPASWFPQEDVETTEETEDGPYVRWSGLTLIRQRHFANRAHLTVATARVATVQIGRAHV